MKRIATVLLVLLTLAFDTEGAGKDAVPDYAYYGFEPEIVTNYISSKKKMGFVRISVELMVKNPDDLIALEHHDPLLRAAMVEILGNQAENKVKSLTGREEIRRECYEMINRLMEQETGRGFVVNLLFTRYLYD
ncbi:flagellar basal body-associated protein FliL [Shewanella denitrificans OS217]|jgi:flagellar protein FliL|uniref:Flagellar protein FliL n=1 Tax=Shewanella denitrificans (strain OS217 / ATCC BAA-1090 / DSM 15013) TaxID=318161 RepID=Q12T33_SHEDO|nr:flagellar basal body-associated protein FliL [Shewanella denitrificans]ABE53393.1 flagellar basal body-associated protein FliL [Shewanella denitrificans OS217]